MSMGLDRHVRQDLLNRLCWNVLGSLDAIEILCKLYKQTKNSMLVCKRVPKWVQLWLPIYSSARSLVGLQRCVCNVE
jgi:hypothetical protein